MNQKTRSLALLAAVAMVFVMVASSLFVIHNAIHECDGECCQICQQIELCTTHSETFAVAVITAAFTMAMVWVSRCRAEGPETIFVPGSLVTLKVKLSN